MPGSGQPSVPVIFSSGSSGLAVVTAPFSLIPQAEMIEALSVSCARDTRARGIGAPAETKTLSDGVAVPVSMQCSVSPERNGVAPIVQVAFSSLICRAISSGVNTSCRIAVAPSMAGKTSPYMKPSWCPMGEGMWMMSCSPICRRSAKGTRLESMVLEVWVTPLGSPVVPEV
jgi:hypothetical protein